MILPVLFACTAPELAEIYTPLYLAPGEVDTAFVYFGPGVLLEWTCTDPELRVTFIPDYIELFSVVPNGAVAKLSVAASTYATVDGTCSILTPGREDEVQVYLLSE